MKLFLLLAFSFVLHISQAQQVRTAPRPKPSPTPKAKVPIVTASIGGMQAGTYGVGAGKILIDSNLVLKDEKGVRYPLDRCTFMYKRKMTYTDENTGEKRVSWEYLAKELRNGEQLDNFWRSTIKEDLQTGEQLIFEKILADSKKGYKIPVKGLTITVK